MKNDTTFVRMRSGDHLGDAKMSKKGTCHVHLKLRGGRAQTSTHCTASLSLELHTLARVTMEER